MKLRGHSPVLLEEAMEGLDIRGDGTYVDCTFGRGGHSQGILQRLGARGRLLGLDRDADVLPYAREISDSRFIFVRSEFSRLSEVLRDNGIAHIEGALLDLGVSSPQLDDAARGFSFRQDGPLDMRMDQSKGLSAGEWLANASEKEIEEVLRNHGEERFAKQISRAVVQARIRAPIHTTRQLANIVASHVRTRERGQDPATRSFQGLRIFINQELQELSLVLPQIRTALSAFGRLVVISFHSLEDRIVKNFLREKPDLPEKLPLRAKDIAPPLMREIARVRPSASEITRNPKAKSAVMRIGERSA
ncbi:MAG TPA: 16S rRNA (cytosine(1402)-N(4))-methyltransferase RsmH [Burkholderiales bacterium]|nr:16S rRNA (cytosine(1402)-N(4))-methyltransferase RsmH [Burkholderiales bacterium]